MTGSDFKYIHDMIWAGLSFCLCTLLVISLLGKLEKCGWVRYGGKGGLVYCWAVTAPLYLVDTPSVTHGCTPAHTDVQAEYKSALARSICLAPRPWGLSRILHLCVCANTAQRVCECTGFNDTWVQGSIFTARHLRDISHGWLSQRYMRVTLAVKLK